jgi:ubiquinone/menaquinone biosynthesis C-methylase UbiE
MSNERTMSHSVGAVLHSAMFYDFIVWITLFGRARRLRERLLQLSRLKAGERVLDVGCGTGTLALMAERFVGATGAVYGIDASPEMIARARVKAEGARTDIRFEVAAAQALPLPDASLDVVLSTLMLHHLGRNARRQLSSEMRRVLKPGGRALLVDFGTSNRQQKGLLTHLHRGHGHTDRREVVELLEQAGLHVEDSGEVGIKKGLHFTLATVRN